MAEVSYQDLQERCSGNFASFSYLVQDPGWMDPIHEKLCNWIQDNIEKQFPRGTDVNNPTITKTINLAIVMPRGSLKTTFCSRNLPAWLTAYFGSEIRGLVVTNTHPNAKKKLSNITGLFESHSEFKAVFPNLKKGTIWNTEKAVLQRNGVYEDGTFESAGVGTKKTGSHYNYIIEDDTLAPDADEMSEGFTLPSQESMDRAIGYHQAAHSLLVPKGLRLRIVVSTRWGENDLIAHLQKQGDWLFFDMPALREDGSPNFTMFYSKEMLEEIERSIGPYMLSCLYLNKPLDPRLRVFKEDAISVAKREQLPLSEYDYLTIACDPAISKKIGACETSITVCGHRRCGNSSILSALDLTSKQLSSGETCEELLRLFECWGKDELVRAIIIENVAYQQSLLERVRDLFAEHGYSCPVVPFSSRKDKKERIRNSLEPLFHSRRIEISPAIHAAIAKQLENFPNSDLVDIIDSLSMHVPHMQGSRMNRKEEEPPPQENPLSLEAALAELRAKHTAEVGTRTIIRRTNAEFRRVQKSPFGLGRVFEAAGDTFPGTFSRN